MEVKLISSEYQLLTYEQVPAYHYFVVEGDPLLKLYLKTQDPGAFLLQDGGAQWQGAMFFKDKRLREVLVRSVGIDIKKTTSHLPQSW
jgi:hypothetical protein